LEVVGNHYFIFPERRREIAARLSQLRRLSQALPLTGQA